MQKNKNISPQKSFVSGVLAGHDNRVSCLGVTEVKFFLHIGTPFSANIALFALLASTPQ